MVVLDEYSAALADAIEEVLEGWVQRSVERVIRATGGPTRDLSAQAGAVGRRAATVVAEEVRRLLADDVDRQRSTPLGLLREAVRYPTMVLSAAGLPPVDRDEVRERLFPDDVYDLAPATFADVDPALAGPGLIWGASKAAAVLARRRGSSPT